MSEHSSEASTAVPVVDAGPSPDSLWLDAGMPVLFVLLWSTGFVVAKLGLPSSPTLTFLMLRYAGVLAVLVPLVLLMRAPWPRGQATHIAIAGVLVQAGYLSGVWCAIKLGMPAGLSALIVGLQPVLTAFAASTVDERVSRRQWLGLLMGLGGVALVVSEKLTPTGASVLNVALCVFALLSITAGTLYQKRHCPRFDLRTGALIQFGASAIVTLPLAILLEGLDWRFSTVQWTREFIIALGWSVLALSIGAIFLLFALIRKNAATRVSSLMYLTPPVTAVFAWLLFGESFGLSGVAGMLLAVAGVAFVVRR
jgi:drug/metabolite transporter (DMT)-like permease